MKEYIINVYLYPKTYDITAESQEEAEKIARERFSNDTNGASVWDIEIAN